MPSARAIQGYAVAPVLTHQALTIPIAIEACVPIVLTVRFAGESHWHEGGIHCCTGRQKQLCFPGSFLAGGIDRACFFSRSAAKHIFRSMRERGVWLHQYSNRLVPRIRQTIAVQEQPKRVGILSQWVGLATLRQSIPSERMPGGLRVPQVLTIRCDDENQWHGVAHICLLESVLTDRSVRGKLNKRNKRMWTVRSCLTAAVDSLGCGRPL
jgi:hypothetical protein